MLLVEVGVELLNHLFLEVVMVEVEEQVVFVVEYYLYHQTVHIQLQLELEDQEHLMIQLQEDQEHLQIFQQ
ncbi:MAG: hypothetical protein EBR82_27580 [Caulobacteraceae bacterium]|nr:hypothetical protein [Caulobacteraceae bacterium]